MNKTSQKQILGWIAVFAIAFVTTNTNEARQFQVDPSTNISTTNESRSLKPIIKVEEYRYLERELVKKNKDQSLLDLFFGDNKENDHSSLSASNPSKTNRILLPEMVGGLPALFSNIEYPNQAKALGVEGIVKAEFTVTELGMVENIEIIEGIGAGCDEEVIKALKRTRFSPAVRNGRFVKVRLSQSILFELKQLKE